MEPWACHGNFVEMTTSAPFRDLLHANGFTSRPKEGVLRIFSPLKYPKASAWIEPANLGTQGQHATPRPPKARIYIYIYRERERERERDR